MDFYAHVVGGMKYQAIPEDMKISINTIRYCLTGLFFHVTNSMAMQTARLISGAIQCRAVKSHRNKLD
jgi:hypothetical protein